MRSDFESITPIALAAIGTVGDELTFTYPKVLEVIRLCTANEIAVLGVELFEVRSGGYAWKSLSTYDQQFGKRWCLWQLGSRLACLPRLPANG